MCHGFWEQAFKFIAEEVKEHSRKEYFKLAAAQCQEGDLQGLYERTKGLTKHPFTTKLDSSQLTETLQTSLHAPSQPED
jgi:hypothetical protein